MSYMKEKDIPVLFTNTDALDGWRRRADDERPHLDDDGRSW